jgi:hypothetical protein
MLRESFGRRLPHKTILCAAALHCNLPMQSASARKQCGNVPMSASVMKIMSLENFVEEVQVLSRDLVDKIRGLIYEGNVQRIVVKDEHGNTFVEIPVTVAAIGVILAPLLAAMGAISALVAKFTIVVVRSEPKPPQGGESTPQTPPT